jgi:hypothetical protein
MKFGYMLLGVFLLTTLGCQARTKTEVTYGKEKDWYQDFFARHLVTLERIDGNVKMVSDGACGIWDNESGSFSSTFILAPRGKFSKSPDHHSWAYFKIIKIGADGIAIKYESSFDHRSFGTELITKDIGTVTLKYKTK